MKGATLLWILGVTVVLSIGVPNPALFVFLGLVNTICVFLWVTGDDGPTSRSLDDYDDMGSGGD